jgi:hypothetical protein
MTGGSSGASKTIGTLLLGTLIGGGALGGYMYMLLSDARENTRIVEASRDALDKSLKEQDELRKQLSTE